MSYFVTDNKVLAIGDVNGKFEGLIKRLTAINNKNGPFELAVCVGEFFGPDDDENRKAKNGIYQFPIPFYILGPCCPSTASYYPESGVDFSPSLTYLGRQGVLRSACGLTIGYLSGLEAKERNAFQFVDLDVDKVINFQLCQQNFVGIDILVTSMWPKDVAKHSTNQPTREIEGSSSVSRMAAGLKPRYHFAGLGSHYERSPYRNHQVLVQSAEHTTRFVGLAPAFNDQKERWIYAFTAKPIKDLNKADRIKQDEGTTEFPYRDIIQHYAMVTAGRNRNIESKDIVKRTFNFQQPIVTEVVSDPNAKKRRVDEDGPSGSGSSGDAGHSGRSSRKHLSRPQTITEENCWFCLSNNKAETHLIVSISTHCYMAMPKGPLNNHHTMVLPIDHVQSLVAATQEVRDEVLRFRDAYTLALAAKGMTLVLFERNYKTSHCQVQFVPVPKGNAKYLRSKFVEEASRRGMEMVFMKEDEQLTDIVNEGTPYFYVELPDTTRLFTKSMAGFPLQFAREILCSPTILNTPDKVDWQQCTLNKTQETKVTQDIKTMFKTYDFGEEDSDED